MVDLVKIRRKAKKKKAARSGPAEESKPTSGAERVETRPAKKAAARGKRGSTTRSKAVPKAAQKTAPRRKKVKPTEEPETLVQETPKAIEEPAPAVEMTVNTDEAQAHEEPASQAPDTEEPEPAVPEEEIEVPERLETFRREAGTRTEAESPNLVDAAAEDGETENELLTFVIAGEHYAVEIERIVEIIRPRSATRVPNAAESIVGIISLRGMIVTLLDLRKILGHPGVDDLGEDARVVVVDRDGETAGFIVDRVSRVIKVDPSKIEGHPVVSSNEHSEFVSGVFRHGTELMILLDLEKVLA